MLHSLSWLVILSMTVALSSATIHVPAEVKPNATVSATHHLTNIQNEFTCFKVEKGVMECEVSPGVFKEYENDAEMVLDFGTTFLMTPHTKVLLRFGLMLLGYYA